MKLDTENILIVWFLLKGFKEVFDKLISFIYIWRRYIQIEASSRFQLFKFLISVIKLFVDYFSILLSFDVELVILWINGLKINNKNLILKQTMCFFLWFMWIFLTVIFKSLKHFSSHVSATLLKTNNHVFTLTGTWRFFSQFYFFLDVLSLDKCSLLYQFVFLTINLFSRYLTRIIWETEHCSVLLFN